MNLPDISKTNYELPHSIEAEQALLGELLINNDSLNEISIALRPEHFALPFHQKLYDFILKKINLNQLASPITLKEFFNGEEKIGDITIYEYLTQLSINAVTISNAASYAGTIYDRYMRRQLINIGQDITTTAFTASIDVTPVQQIESAEQHLFNLAERGQVSSGFSPFKTALVNSLELATKAYNNKSKLSGYATYFKTIDNKLGGMAPSDLIILAGRPGMGKTSLATNIAYNIARNYDKEKNEGGIVGFFSLEMSSAQLATRIISEQAKISADKLRRGAILEHEYRTLGEVAASLENLPLFIDDTGGASIAQIATRARRLKRQKGLDVLIIDYIQLIHGTKKTANANRVTEITEVTVGLKALAKELNIPIIALSQLSRQVETREGKRPQLSDLRESGSIEQDADLVLFIFREAYYKAQQKPEENTAEHEQWQAEMETILKKAEVIIAKHRHGSIGNISLIFEAEFTRFYDITNTNYLPAQIGM